MHTCVEGSKRQLPPWMMMQKVGASHVSNSGNVVEANCSTENGDNITANVRKEDHKRETSRRKSNFNAKCEVKGRRGNLGQQNESGDNNIAQKKKKKGNRSQQNESGDNNIAQKKKKKGNRSQQNESGYNVAQKKKKKGNKSRDRALRSSIKKGQNIEDLSHGSSDDVYPVQASSDDDMELTVEDLMAIAEQYVKDYENKEQRKTPSRQSESKWQFPATTEAGTTLDSPCENKISSSSEWEALYNSAPTTGELTLTSTSQTDHPAQDMLDVFLGPLLRKTLEKEEKSKSSLESLEITHEFTRQSQNEPGEEEMVPLTKKRNTLKDKVAMFLD